MNFGLITIQSDTRLFLTEIRETTEAMSRRKDSSINFPNWCEGKVLTWDGGALKVFENRAKLISNARAGKRQGGP